MRIRMLCNQLDCPFCRTRLDRVVYSSDPSAVYEDAIRTPHALPPSLGAVAADERAADEVARVLELRCCVCSAAPFARIALLRDHLAQAHELTFCPVCLGGRRVFVSEQRVYARSELQAHYRGTVAEDVPGLAVHPVCTFCRQRLFDDDAMLEHLYVQHEQCSACRQLGRPLVFMPNYDRLLEHFRAEHFLCEDAACLADRYIVFANELDLRAHQLARHADADGRVRRSCDRQMRNIDRLFEYRYAAPRGDAVSQMESSRAAGIRRHRAQCDDTTEDLDAVMAAPATSDASRAASADARSSTDVVPGGLDEFPALTSLAPAPSPATPQSLLAYARSSGPRADALHNPDDFPSLAASVAGSAASAAIHDSNASFPVLGTRAAGRPPTGAWIAGRGASRAVAHPRGGADAALARAAVAQLSLGPATATASAGSARAATATTTTTTAAAVSAATTMAPAATTTVAAAAALRAATAARVASTTRVAGSSVDAARATAAAMAPSAWPALSAMSAAAVATAAPTWPAPSEPARRGAWDTEHRAADYIEAPNFAARNRALLQAVAEALGSPVRLADFQRAASQYARGALDARAFCGRAEASLGRAAWHRLFAEFVALLPSTRLQRPLVAAFDGPADAVRCSACRHCGQVVRDVDAVAHERVHRDPFPSLPGR